MALPFSHKVSLATTGVCVFVRFASASALFYFKEGIKMGLLGLGKVVAATMSVAAAGLAVANQVVKSKETKLKELDDEFAGITKEYKSQRIKIEEKAGRGDKKSIKKHKELDDEYFESKAEYEKEREKLVEKMKKKNGKAEMKELEHRMEMEKMEAQHQMEMEKMRYIGEHAQSAPAETPPIPKVKSSALGRVECPDCGHQNEGGAKFCGACGAKLSVLKFCTGCGARLDGVSKFCSMCGKPLQ